MLIVQKFGGSSLADISGLRRAAEIILSAVNRGCKVAAVVSAMGDSTDELCSFAHRISPKPCPRELDALLATGELQSAALLSMMLCHLGQPAKSFSGPMAGIVCTAEYGDGEVISVSPTKVTTALNEGYIAVVAGFQGESETGDVCTLGRGGSDTSAVALAAALGAEVCEIYKDVDGIYTADPMLAKDAKLLSHIDFRDMEALTLRGSQVLHSRSVSTAMREGLPMLILSSFKSCAGTAVCSLDDAQRPDFAGITRDKTKNSLSLVGKAVDENCLERLCRLFKKENVEILSAELQMGCLSLCLKEEDLKRALQLAHTEFF